MLRRTDEALVVCEEVVSRFWDSESPTILEPLANALYYKGLMFVFMKQPEEALAVWEALVRRFEGHGAPIAFGPVPMASVSRGIILRRLNRAHDALNAFDEAVERFGGSESHEVQLPVEMALLEKADLQLKLQQYEAARGTADRLLEQRRTVLPKNRLRGHLIRAEAALALADRTACERDVQAILVLMREVDHLGGECLDALMILSVGVGPERMRELVKASPSATLLLPFTIALEREIGIESRVAREVEEVAIDIRRDCRNSGRGEAMASHISPDPRDGWASG